jgi:penicillin-insensitive murein endopeptidase
VTRSPRTAALAALAALFLACSGLARAAGSQCFGTPANGHIEGSVALRGGANVSPYSGLGVSLGRTHVHTAVADIVADAYAALAAQTPDVRYVYGETGWPSGGRLRPHRSHQNGTSVDFFVPVRNAAGASVPLPTRVSDKFGYNVEFDADARWGEYRIDFPALAEHLYQLHRAATAAASVSRRSSSTNRTCRACSPRRAAPICSST